MTTVLVVDDEETLGDVVAEILRDEGYDVVTARDGRAAVAAYAEGPPDLVLMDVVMPVMDGLAAYRAMRAMTSDGGAGAAVPIVLTSAATTPANLDPGIDGFLAKPYDLDRLLALVARLAGPPAPSRRGS